MGYVEREVTEGVSMLSSQMIVIYCSSGQLSCTNPLKGEVMCVFKYKTADMFILQKGMRIRRKGKRRGRSRRIKDVAIMLEAGDKVNVFIV